MLTADARSRSTLGRSGGSGPFSFSFNIEVESQRNLQREKKLNQLKFKKFLGPVRELKSQNNCSLKSGNMCKYREKQCRLIVKKHGSIHRERPLHSRFGEFLEAEWVTA